MATFNVFVEGASDDAPTALPQLAEAMAQRYGLSPNDLVARLRRGRFRVKSNVDAATAERLRRDLEAIGARVLVEDSAISPTATPVAGIPAMRPSTPPSGLAAAGPAHQRPSTPIPTNAKDLASGLSAAFNDSGAEQDLGALASGSLALASLDGEEAPPAGNQFDAPPEPPPKPTRAPEPPRAKPASQPMDLFAPPDAGDQDFKVDVAVEDAPPERPTPRPSAAPATSQPMSTTTRRTPVSVDAVVAAEPSRRQFDRQRFVLGVVLALVIGFVPAHFIAKMREKSAFDAVDAKIAQAHAAADSTETWMALDGARAKLREEKESARTKIALTSMLIWAVVAAGIAFAITRYQPKPKQSAA